MHQIAEVALGAQTMKRRPHRHEIIVLVDKLPFAMDHENIKFSDLIFVHGRQCRGIVRYKKGWGFICESCMESDGISNVVIPVTAREKEDFETLGECLGYFESRGAACIWKNTKRVVIA